LVRRPLHAVAAFATLILRSVACSARSVFQVSARHLLCFCELLALTPSALNADLTYQLFHQRRRTTP